MMELSRLVAKHFEYHIRQRGESYYKDVLVEICEGDASCVEAKVSGIRNYNISLTLKNNVLTVECSCPYFSSTGPCKHIWATLLEAEDAGHLTAFDSQRPVRLRQTELRDEEDLSEAHHIDESLPLREYINAIKIFSLAILGWAG